MPFTLKPPYPVALIAVLLVALAWGGVALARTEPPRLGVLYHRDDADVTAVLEGLRDGFRLAEREVTWIEADAKGDDAGGRIALEGLRIEGVEMIVAVGERASQVVARGKRDRPVLCTGLSDAERVLGPSAADLAGTTSHLAADEIAAWLRRARPAWNRLTVLVGGAESYTGRRAQALRESVLAAEAQVGAIRHVEILTDAAGDLAERATDWAERLRERHVVWIERDVDARLVDRLARSLRGTGIVLIGSRLSHLDAGCSLVIRPDGRAHGQRAAGVLARLLDGASTDELGFADIGSHRVEVNLVAARRLGRDLPLPLLARADHIRRPPTRKVR